MDKEEKIEALISENELLQLELDDLKAQLKRRDNEINILGDSMDTAASLQSRIDANLLEIEQLRYNNEIATQKAAGVEMINEELEVNLLRTMKEKQRQEATIKGLNSVKTELDITNWELNETVPLYAQLQKTTEALGEANSNNALLQQEIDDLKAAAEEREALIALLKKQKFD